MEQNKDVFRLVREVQAAARSARDHRAMISSLAGRISGLQSLIASLIEDAGEACPGEFLERLQEELEAAASAMKRCTRSVGYRERYFEDITVDLKDVNFRIANWLGDLRAHIVSAGMQEGVSERHHQERAMKILRQIRESQEQFEDFGAFAAAEQKDSRGQSVDPSRKPSVSMNVRRSIDSRRGGMRPGSISMESRSRADNIDVNSSFESDSSPRPLWSEAQMQQERRGEVESGRSEKRTRTSRKSAEMLGEDGEAILYPPEAVDFHDEVDRVLSALENAGDMDRVIQQIIETQTLGEKEREFLVGKTEKLKKERGAAKAKGAAFGEVGASPWGEKEERGNRQRPATDTEQDLLRDVEEARRMAKEFREGNKRYQDELLGSEAGYLPQSVKEEAQVAVVEITTALAVATEPKRSSMERILESEDQRIPEAEDLARRVSMALVAAGNKEGSTTRRRSGGFTASIIPMDLPKARRPKRVLAGEPHTLEDDIAAALKAAEEATGAKVQQQQSNEVKGVIAIGTHGPVAIGAKVGGITGWPAGLLRTSSMPPGPSARTNPEALLKDKQREEASVMEKVYQALKAVEIGEKVDTEQIVAGDNKVGTSFCALPTGPKVLRKDTKEVKKEIFSFLDEINAALENARSGPPPGSEKLSREPPAEFICPLSGLLMQDPVLLIESEQNYEREYIEQWFAKGHKVCPASGVAIHTTTTLRNHKLRGEIVDWSKLEELCPRQDLIQPRAQVPLSSIPEKRVLKKTASKLDTKGRSVPNNQEPKKGAVKTGAEKKGPGKATGGPVKKAPGQKKAPVKKEDKPGAEANKTSSEIVSAGGEIAAAESEAKQSDKDGELLVSERSSNQESPESETVGAVTSLLEATKSRVRATINHLNYSIASEASKEAQKGG